MVSQAQKRRIREEFDNRMSSIYDTDQRIAIMAQREIGGTYRDIDMDQNQRQLMLETIKSNSQWFDETSIRNQFRERLLEFLDPWKTTSRWNYGYSRRPSSQSKSAGGGASAGPSYRQMAAPDQQQQQIRKRQSSSMPPPLPRSLTRGLKAFSAVRSTAVFQRLREWYKNLEFSDQVMTEANIRNFFRQQGSYTDLIQDTYSRSKKSHHPILEKTLQILSTPPFDAYPDVDRFRLSLMRRLGTDPMLWFRQYGSGLCGKSNDLARDYIRWVVDLRHEWTLGIIIIISHLFPLPFHTIIHLTALHPIPESRWSDLQEHLVHDDCDKLEFLVHLPFHNNKQVRIDDMIDAFRNCNDDGRRRECQLIVEKMIDANLKRKNYSISTLTSTSTTYYWNLWTSALRELRWIPNKIHIDILFSENIDVDTQFRAFVDEFTVPVDAPRNFVYSTFYEEMPKSRVWYFDPERHKAEWNQLQIKKLGSYDMTPSKSQKLQLLLLSGFTMPDTSWDSPILFKILLPVIEQLYTSKIRRLKEFLRIIDPEFLKLHPEFFDLPVHNDFLYTSWREYRYGNDRGRYDHARHLHILSQLEQHINRLFDQAQKKKQSTQRLQMSMNDAKQLQRQQQRLRGSLQRLSGQIAQTEKTKPTSGDAYDKLVDDARGIDKQIHDLYNRTIARFHIPSIFQFEARNRDSLINKKQKREKIVMTRYLAGKHVIPLLPLMLRNVSTVSTSRLPDGHTGINTLDKYSKSVMEAYLESLPNEEMRRRAHDISVLFG